MLWVPGVAETELAEVWSAADGIAETSVCSAWQTRVGSKDSSPHMKPKSNLLFQGMNI